MAKIAKDQDVNNAEMSSDTSLTLLDKVREKDQAAWCRMVSLYSPLIYYWCRGAGLQETDAEEIGQEVFIAVARKIGDFRKEGEKDSFRAWLRVITRNKLRDLKRPLGGQGVGGSEVQGFLLQIPDNSSAAVDPETESLESNLLYRRGLEMLEVKFEEKTRNAFWLRMAGKSAKEVALELGMTPSAVDTAKSKILRALREDFGDLLDLTTLQRKRKE